jgi:hypothetical protein
LDIPEFSAHAQDRRDGGGTVRENAMMRPLAAWIIIAVVALWPSSGRAISPATSEQMFCVAHHFLIGTVLPDQPTNDCKGKTEIFRRCVMLFSVRVGELIAGDFGDLATFGFISLAPGDRLTVALQKQRFRVGGVAHPSDHQGHLLTDPAATDQDVLQDLVGKTFIFGLVDSFARGTTQIWSTEFRARIETELKKNKAGCPRLQRN